MTFLSLHCCVNSSALLSVAIEECQFCIWLAILPSLMVPLILHSHMHMMNNDNVYICIGTAWVLFLHIVGVFLLCTLLIMGNGILPPPLFGIRIFISFFFIFTFFLFYILKKTRAHIIISPGFGSLIFGLACKYWYERSEEEEMCSWLLPNKLIYSPPHRLRGTTASFL